jgi:D-3-phosphoglycerate dehydrogenase
MNKILFLDTTHPILLKKLENYGYICDQQYSIDYSEISKIINNYVGIVIRSRIQLDKEILSKATKLKFIGRVGAGLESIDTEFAKLKNIECFNSPEGSRDAVGEQAMGLLLSLLTNINKSNSEIKEGKWLREENRGIELKNKTVGIIGYGNMGSAFAKKLSGFETNVISYDKYKTNYTDGFTTEVSLDEIFKLSDILSLHVPLTEETKYMVNHKFLKKFKKNIYLINTSRGAVVETESLLNAIDQGKVKGAGLDVIEYEETSFDKMDLNNMPATFYYLLNNPKVIITPHSAGWTHESKIKLADILADKIIAFSIKNSIFNL